MGYWLSLLITTNGIETGSNVQIGLLLIKAFFEHCQNSAKANTIASAVVFVAKDPDTFSIITSHLQVI